MSRIKTKQNKQTCICATMSPDLAVSLGRELLYLAFLNVWAADILISQSQSLHASCHPSPQMHPNLGIVWATRPLGREGRTWGQGKGLPAEAERSQHGTVRWHRAKEPSFTAVCLWAGTYLLRCHICAMGTMTAPESTAEGIREKPRTQSFLSAPLLSRVSVESRYHFPSSH